MIVRLLIALMVLLAPALPTLALASPIDIDLGAAMLRPEEDPGLALAVESVRFTKQVGELPVISKDAWRHAGLDPIDYQIYALLSEESWSQWQKFQRSAGSVVPLTSMRNVLVLVRAGYMAKRPMRATGEAGGGKGAPGGITYVPGEKLEQAVEMRLLRYLVYSPPPKALGLISLGTEREAKGFSLGRLLTEEGGIFSSRPWSWENFVPRLFTVAGILAAALVTVELLHFIIRFGLGGMRRRRRDQPEEDLQL